ncbi:MAG: NAD+ synthase [Chitinivibrionales bacterium]|nr:NAD+ synthase [Chitinivibrionales bacterium]
MRITLCQLNSTMGDIAGNTRKVKDALASTHQEHPDLLVFSELFIQGYPPRDLLEHDWFIRKSEEAVDALCTESERYPDTGILIGTALGNGDGPGKRLTNSAVLIYRGSVIYRQDKTLLPNYDVFDETRYFDSARSVGIVDFKGEKPAVTVCEDAWNSPDMWPRRMYEGEPVGALAAQGATLIINIAGSPFHLGKQKFRYQLMQNHAQRHGMPFVFLNQIGGNDELIFDGGSLIFDRRGNVIDALPSFEESIRTIDMSRPGGGEKPRGFDSIASVYRALILGLRDYVAKCGFTKTLLGLSGGIDSAVTCALAAAALGPENVLGITMPSRYSTGGSITDSKKLADNLGIPFREIDIESVFNALYDTMQPHFAGMEPGVAEENMQARIRGTILMSMSNKFGSLLLTTGNKSELAVGYCTLYGDMNGGLAVISDLPKTKVYELARYINRDSEIIPQSTIDKAPSAELRHDQKDQDTLPPYELLDEILRLLLEEQRSKRDLLDRSFDEATVSWVIRALKVNEYKRRQAPLGLKVTPKAFGSGRRFPIAARYDI